MSISQKNYAKRCEGLENVIYKVITNPAQIANTIENVIGHYRKIIDEIDF
jgi:hypothetical protein